MKQGYSLTDMEKIAREIRKTIVRMSHDSGASHLGSALSCVDILVALYWRISKFWEAYYVV